MYKIILTPQKDGCVADVVWDDGTNHAKVCPSYDDGLRWTKTHIIHRKVADAMGYEINDKDIALVQKHFDGVPLKRLESDLATCVVEFHNQGGRGVELADMIDELRIAIAARLP